MTVEALSNILGLALGTWLLAAGGRKLLDRRSFEAVLEKALWPGVRPTVLRSVSVGLPIVEMGLGISACVSPLRFVRLSILCLFVLFVAAVLRLSLRHTHFDCGCLGLHRSERREVVIARTVGGAMLASLWIALPHPEVLGPVQAVTLAGSTWSVVLLSGVAIRLIAMRKVVGEGE